MSFHLFCFASSIDVLMFVILADTIPAAGFGMIISFFSGIVVPLLLVGVDVLYSDLTYTGLVVIFFFIMLAILISNYSLVMCSYCCLPA